MPLAFISYQLSICLLPFFPLCLLHQLTATSPVLLPEKPVTCLPCLRQAGDRQAETGVALFVVVPLDEMQADVIEEMNPTPQ